MAIIAVAALEHRYDLFALSGALADLKRAVGTDITSTARTPAQGGGQ